jgi:hypothetical protein
MTRGTRIAIAVLCLVLAALVGGTATALITGYADTENPAGDMPRIAVVHSGLPWDGRHIRTVLAPDQDRTWVGFFADVHDYPAGNRQYVIQDRRCPDGLQMVRDHSGHIWGLSGVIWFRVNDADPAAMVNFDAKFWPYFQGRDLMDGWNHYLETRFLGDLSYGLPAALPGLKPGVVFRPQSSTIPGLSAWVTQMSEGTFTNARVELDQVLLLTNPASVPSGCPVPDGS